MLKICGSNIPTRLGEKSNNEDCGGDPAINPPINSNLNVSSISSYSSYGGQAVVITTDGEILAAGDNTDGRISSSLPKKNLTQFTKYEIKDIKGHKYFPVSAVCCWEYTVYIVSPSKSSNETLLACSYPNIETASPLFLKTDNSNPVSLFGSIINAAAINDEGSIIFIEQDSLSEEFKSNPLPNNDEAVSVAFCSDNIFALGKNGNVYVSDIPTKGTKLSFILEKRLKTKKIIEISGTNNHCLALSEDGSVFGIGTNALGELGFGKNIRMSFDFKLISPLSNQKVRHVGAGFNHSLFQTENGNILECGSAYYGQLISCKPGYEIVFLPKETGIVEKDSFCMACNVTTAIFIGHDPVRSPNRRIPQKSISQLEEENKSLRSTIKTIQQKVEILTQKSISQLEAENKSLRSTIKTLQQKVEILTQKSANQFEVLDGDIIDKLKIVKEIGHGAQSKVIKVIREKEYALKMIETNKVKISNIKNLLKEYELINLLSHPNIIKTYGFSLGNEKNPPSILLEFCPKCLSDIVDKMTDFERVCSIFEICRGMEIVHEASMIHRDLKPDNIMFGEDGHVRVSDFGVSCILSVENQMNSLTSGVGTLKFMAPELLNESKHYNNKVDVYSFGVVVYFILTGGKLPQISIIAIGNGLKAEIPKNINSISSSLINDCWSTDANDRPSFSEIKKFIISNEFKLIDGIEKEICEIKNFLSI